jgi:hypothetical protein
MNRHARFLSRKCASCKDEDKKKEETHNQLARKESNRAAEAPSTIPGIVHDVLRSPGAPLDSSTRSFMEPRFGRDFSNVRVHTDSRAAQSASAVNALAYTVGNHVVLGRGQQSLPLMAHELVHVEQQHGSSDTAPSRIDELGSPREREADRIAADVMNAATTASPSASGAGLMRMPVVNAGNGTTEELKKEIDRLKEEQKTRPADEQDAYTKRIAQLETYLAERGNSTLADCPFSMLFNGSELKLSGAVTASYPAVSGEPNAAGKFDYSPEQQKTAGGPIPEGEYWINPDQMTLLGFGEKIRLKNAPYKSWGDNRITIHPFDSTHTFGRGGFFIHGGAVPGSIGCIDLTSSMDSFALKVQAYQATNCKAKLLVNYPKLVPDKSPVPKGSAMA